jgi:uncharacterized spore protein YtfJ
MVVQELLQQVAQDLKEFARTETIFGEPMEIQGNTVIPVCKLGIGYGGGGGEGEGEGGEKAGGKGSGGGGGGAVKLDPAALVIVKDGEVSVVGIQTKESRLTKILEMLPETIERMQRQTSDGADADDERHDNHDEMG